MLSKGNELLRHYPFRYEDLRRYEKGVVVSARNIYTRYGKTVQKISVRVSNKTRELTYFNQPFLTKTLRPGVNVSLAGNDYEINGPNIHTGRLVPIYPETKGVTSKMLRRRIWNLLKQPIKDWLPNKIKTKYGLIDLDRALRQIHFPKNQTEANQAKKRLAFEEMLLLQLKAQAQKASWQEKRLAHRLVIDQEKLLALISDLPFRLTPSQNLALKEILADLGSGRPMNRLLCGEVGSGKTVIAACAMYLSCLNGFQAVLLAPTEILIEQHYRTLKAVFSGTPVKIGRVTKSIKEEGDILVGTQALLFRRLDNVALVVIDEQHRFGVKQRSLLLQKQPTPHVLSMTATPIPRTMALTAYAHLDLSTLDNLPGKQNAKTWIVPEAKRLDAYHWINKQILKEKSQAFIVCPLIDPSEKESMKDIKAVTQEFNYLKSVFGQLKLELLHGRLKSEEKNKIVSEFTHRNIDILVTTPVIEVGIDIPQAGVMIIEAAERFGLAQLHQLRGRVGRRGQPGYCLLFGQTDNRRLKALTTITDGINLAELDLQWRGPGETWGLAQHGFFRLKLADPLDLQLIALTRKAAASIIDSCRHNQNERFHPGAEVSAAPALN